MSIVIERNIIEHIPALVIHDQEQQAAPLPVVIYFHGFTSAKEQNLSIAYLLAEQGYRVVLPDSLHHGERRGDVSDNQVQFDFWKIVNQNLQDLPKLYEWLNEAALLEKNRLAVAGTSMGGITTAAALTQYDWINASAIMMGSAKLEDMAKNLLKGMEEQGIEIPLSQQDIDAQLAGLKMIDFSNQLEKLADRPLFIWHGDRDPVVPYAHAEELYQSLSETGAKEQVTFVREANRDHKVSRDAMLQLRNWMIAYV
ncbi:esterase [Halalkalibacillus halophilus]|uniref:esterase n=1 Tax=Halalkalibacillus halophilus TaxID=392827 RepID=UPI00042100DE|nr:esterase [Halalkalibacillus halophilus]